ncbi:P-loop containing nucleoside triphosphate hydrolase protein, partial [Mycena sp. CBHHK59/15]
AGLFSLQTEIGKGKITLDTIISGEGSNLSVGQQQIVALARAMIRQCKLLILDEDLIGSTIIVDYETDAVIQSSLQHELGSDVTVIKVAHRLQTIMDADRIMVLDAGRIVEFDSPKQLLEIDNGHFRVLLDESEDRDML